MSEKEFKMREATEEERKIVDDYIESISKPVPNKVYMVIFMERQNEKKLKSNLSYRHFASKKSAENFYKEMLQRGYMADWTEVHIYE